MEYTYLYINSLSSSSIFSIYINIMIMFVAWADFTLYDWDYLRHGVKHILLLTLSADIICGYFNHTQASARSHRQIVSVRETGGQTEAHRPMGGLGKEAKLKGLSTCGIFKTNI